MKTGQVTATMDASGLLTAAERLGTDVLNGIAYDPADQTFLITGKLWPKLFRVKIRAVIRAPGLGRPPVRPGRALAPRSRRIPEPVERDFVARDVAFDSGERAEPRFGCTIGPSDSRGRMPTAWSATRSSSCTAPEGAGGASCRRATPAVSSARVSCSTPNRFFIILPDNIGHGQSSKPSDGLHMRFPQYRYTDMVRLQHRLVTEALGLSELHLVMGTSMGAMHAWMWGYMYPSFARGLVPLASNPVEIAGRNRVWRKLLVDAIVTDPDLEERASIRSRRAAWPARSGSC